MVARGTMVSYTAEWENIAANRFFARGDVSAGSTLEERNVTGQRIRVREIVKDLRSGLGDSELMTKYALSEIQLESVFQKLIDADFITSVELWERSRLSDTQITKAFVEAQTAIDQIN